MNMADTKRVKKPWRKILYEKQDYPDNYLDEDQFKRDLKNNLYVKIWSSAEAQMSSLIIIQEVISVFLFLSVFWHLEADVTDSLPFILLFVILTLSSLLFIATALSLSATQAQVTEWLQQSILFIFFLCGTSPILKTLTESISTDSLWFMTIVMFLAHLLFHNYGNEGVLVSEAFSLNAAIFAAVCLASRLSTSLHAFVLILFAVVLFALIPQIRNHFIHKMDKCHIKSIILLLCITVELLIFNVHIKLLIIFCVCLLIASTGPQVFVKLQYIKNTIHGPWDEAVLDLNQL